MTARELNTENLNKDNLQKDNLQKDNLRGIVLMVLGMIAFTLCDTFMKLASAELPTGQVMLALGFGACAVFFVLVRRQGERIIQPAFLKGSIVLRNLGEITAMLGIVTALSQTSLSSVAAIMQIQPLLLTLAGAMFLSEKIGPQRLVAIFVGLCGALLIIRPGASGFDLYSLFAVVGTIGLTMRDFGSRIAPKDVSTALLSFYAALFLILAGVTVAVFQQELLVPDLRASLYLCAMVGFACLGFILVTNAMRLGELSVIGPFRYTRIVFATLVGAVFLGEYTDPLSLVGAAIIVGAGFFVWFREQRGKG